MVIPTIPAGHPDSAKPPKVLVSFYVDEQGRVRLPNVESSATPELVLRALEAVQYWAFKPGTIKGETVLVYTYRSLTFRPENAAAK
jgi:TonB family protein